MKNYFTKQSLRSLARNTVNLFIFRLWLHGKRFIHFSLYILQIIVEEKCGQPLDPPLAPWGGEPSAPCSSPDSSQLGPQLFILVQTLDQSSKRGSNLGLELSKWFIWTRTSRVVQTLAPNCCSKKKSGSELFRGSNLRTLRAWNRNLGKSTCFTRSSEQNSHAGSHLGSELFDFLEHLITTPCGSYLDRDSWRGPGPGTKNPSWFKPKMDENWFKLEWEILDGLSLSPTT
jgi:hypothetical protein